MLNKIHSSAIGLFVAFSVSAAQANIIQPPVLNTSLIQGALVYGKIPPNSTLKKSGKTLKTTPDGGFVFGLDREHDEILTLAVSHNGEEATFKYHVLQRQYRTQSIKGVAQKYVTPPQSRLDRIANENKQVKAARQQFTPHTHYLQAPLMPAKGRITGVYGSQRIFNGTPKRPHYGLDIAAPVGTPIVAPFDGVVSLAHANMYYSGGTLIIDHGMGVSSTFIHLDRIHVKKGDAIKQGQQIANMGATGRVTGPHLDWRINWFNTRLDPALLFTHLPSEIK